MEKYEGVKFRVNILEESLEIDNNFLKILKELNNTAYLFSQLGLTPLHTEGAYGNFSLRLKDDIFIISKTGFIPKEDFKLENFVVVKEVDIKGKEVYAYGVNKPSSEAFLHYLLYNSNKKINFILHGHFELFLKHNSILDIPTTKKFYPYGTIELGYSALELLEEKKDIKLPFIFNLKDHGFVAIGDDLNTTRNLVLEKLKYIIDFIIK